MIDRDRHPVEWAMWLDELADAHEHLGHLLRAASEASSLDEEDFRIQLGHVYAHLNRGWYCRNLERELANEEWGIASRFPPDVAPVG